VKTTSDGTYNKVTSNQQTSTQECLL